MDGSHSCIDCGAALQAEDGHDLCPTCLGHEHLLEALSENPCMNCSFMPHAVRVARLAQLCPQEGSDLPPSGQVVPPKRSKRRGGTTASVPLPRRKRAKPDQGLSTRVEQLSAELAEMKSLLQTRQSDPSLPVVGLSSPPMPELVVEDDVISLAASASHFRDEEEAGSSQASEAGSFSSQSAVGEAGDGSMREVMSMALKQLQLELPQGEASSSGSAFFRRGRAPTPFSVPPSEEYLKELHACWREPRALSRLSSDGRVLAAMHESVKAGLDRMPAIEPAVASLIVSPDEALRPDVRCPRTQCRVTDDLLCKAYNAGARAGRLGNSLAHLMFALSASVQDTGGASAAIGYSDAALQAFALMTRELGRVMSFLVQARRQVWLAQSPLTEACRRTLRGVPVVPGELFGSAALEALERTAQARQTSQQLSGLRRSIPAFPQRSGRPATTPSVQPRPQTGGRPVGSYPHDVRQRPRRDFREPVCRPVRQTRASNPGRPPPRAPRGRGDRR